MSGARAAFFVRMHRLTYSWQWLTAQHIHAETETRNVRIILAKPIWSINLCF